MEYNKVYHNEKVDCYIYVEQPSQKNIMFKHKEWPSRNAIAYVNYILKCWMKTVKKIYIYIYSVGKTKLKTIMYGEFDGGIKVTDEEHNNK